MKKILVPCDFSDPSQEAFRFALKIAARSGGEVIALHVIHIPVIYDGAFAGEAPFAYDPGVIKEIEADAFKSFEKMNINQETQRVPASMDVQYGELITTIKQIIESKKADLIVIGTTGTSGMEEIFIGSNTEKVVRHSKVPVISVPSGSGVDDVQNILLPSTLELDQTDFMAKLKSLQAFFGATLHVLFVNTPSKFISDGEASGALAEFVSHYQLQNCKVHFASYHKEEDGIIDFARQNRMDLIAMGTHARKGLAHLFNRSISENIVNHISMPVWTCALK